MTRDALQNLNCEAVRRLFKELESLVLNRWRESTRTKKDRCPAGYRINCVLLLYIFMATAEQKIDINSSKKFSNEEKPFIQRREELSKLN